MVALQSLLAILSLYSSSALAAAVHKRFEASGHSVHEKRDSLPHGWTRRATLDKARPIRVRINLHQRNMDDDFIEKLMMEISDPHSPKYSEHLSHHEVADLFAPKKESVDEVLAWLLEAGIDVSHAEHYDHYRGAVLVDMPISDAEKLFKTTYHSYVHENGAVHVACEKYSVPNAAKHHVDFIVPTMHFDIPTSRGAHIASPSVRSFDSEEEALAAKRVIDEGGELPAEKRDPTLPQPGPFQGPVIPKVGNQVPNGKVAGADLTHCNSQITPACLRALYGVSYTQKATSKNSYGIVEYSPQTYNAPDLDTFATQYNNKLVGVRPKLKSIDGGAPYDSTDFSVIVESNLDFQYAMNLAYPLVPNLYQTGNNQLSGSFNTFLDALDSSYCGGDDPNYDPQYSPKTCGAFKAPKVISTSYAYNEADLTPAYEKRQCNEYMKLGLLGTTILYSSGDYGVAGNGGNCLDPATNQLDPNGIKFNPSFPGGCPYITSVGATQVSPGNTVKQPEAAANQVIYSGGGFSNVFKLPSYQSAVIKKWFKNPAKYTSQQYNRSGATRGFPDIAVNGVNYVVALNGAFYLVYGTSASSPALGAILSLINDARLAKGKKSIGFINPVLYKNPSALHDITIGNNPGCNTTGFRTRVGWDPVTGLGTPNFPKLLSVFSKLK